MTTATINPYLMLDGTTPRAAMEFYQGVFGGELKIMTFGEAPMESPPELADRVMHAELESGDIRIMASDPPPGMDVRVGDHVVVTIVGSDHEELGRWFNVLAEGGNVTLPFEKQFWGDVCGNVTDKFGVPWMINAVDPQSQS